jgi:hypothetical protein
MRIPKSDINEGNKMNTEINAVCAYKEHFIDFDALEANEEILIETQNSFYKFLIGNAVERRGFLYGGSVGSEGCVAVLMGAVRKQGENYINDPHGLHTEARAFFYIETAHGMKHLITSVITNLCHVKPEENQPLVS